MNISTTDNSPVTHVNLSDFRRIFEGQGAAAFFQGATPDQCPFDEGTVAWSAWQDGLEQALDDWRAGPVVW